MNASPWTEPSRRSACEPLFASTWIALFVILRHRLARQRPPRRRR